MLGWRSHGARRASHAAVSFHRMFTTPPATPTTGALQPPNRDSLAAGRDALDRGAWDEARAHLTASVGERESPEALEQLGLAAWWLDDAALTFDARERAYASIARGTTRGRGARRALARVGLPRLPRRYRRRLRVARARAPAARGPRADGRVRLAAVARGRESRCSGVTIRPPRSERGERAADARPRATGDRGLEFTGLGARGAGAGERGRRRSGDAAARRGHRRRHGRRGEGVAHRRRRVLLADLRLRARARLRPRGAMVRAGAGVHASGGASVRSRRSAGRNTPAC